MASNRCHPPRAGAQAAGATPAAHSETAGTSIVDVVLIVLGIVLVPVCLVLGIVTAVVCVPFLVQAAGCCGVEAGGRAPLVIRVCPGWAWRSRHFPAPSVANSASRRTAPRCLPKPKRGRIGRGPADTSPRPPTT